MKTTANKNFNSHNEPGSGCSFSGGTRSGSVILEDREMIRVYVHTQKKALSIDRTLIDSNYEVWVDQYHTRYAKDIEDARKQVESESMWGDIIEIKQADDEDVVFVKANRGWNE